MPKVKISHKAAQQALDLQQRAMDDPLWANKNGRVLMAAQKLFQLYMTQERWGEAEIDKRAQYPNSSSDIRELAAMSPEDLLRLQAKMVGKAG